ncbi:MAG: hypothetical protein ABIJ95_12730 [Pseudomonadota bacterium]
MMTREQMLETTNLAAGAFREGLGDRLVSVVLHGSVLTDDFDPKRSDANLLVTLTETGMDELDRCLGLVHRWRKKRVATPLFLTQSDIASSLDTFPVEFLNMRRAYSVLEGTDVLSGLGFDPGHVFRQCEREMKGKLILLRQGWMSSGSRDRDLAGLMAETVSTFAFLFNGILHALGREVPKTRAESLSQGCGAMGLDDGHFLKILEIRAQGKPSRGENVSGLFRAYLADIRAAVRFVDEKTAGPHAAAPEEVS